MFDAVGRGEIKALWISCTNPAQSMPNADKVHAALKRCDFVVVQEAYRNTDSAAFADLLLPASSWGEKEGTVTNSERCISRQRAFLPAPGEARADWSIISEVARRMGHGAAFAYSNAAEIFDEHCRLSAFENDGSRDFDLTGLIGVDYEALAPIQWPVRKPGQGTARLFGQGGFYHADGKARFITVAHRSPRSAVSDEFPLILNTGRTRDQWHTMTRTGKSPRLATHRPPRTRASISSLENMSGGKR